MRGGILIRDRRGFTLVELLIVTALLGIFMAAVLGLVRTTQRHTYTSDEVVEVQQNLRVALDSLSRDLRLGGLGVADDAFITEAPPQLSCTDTNNDGDCLDAGEAEVLRFQTLSATGKVARLGGSGFTTGVDPTAYETIPLASAEMVRLFKGGDYVRIFRPSTRTQPLDRVYWVRKTDEAGPSVIVRGFNAATVLRPGDLILRVADANLDGDNNPNTNPPDHPNSVRYRLIESESEDAAQFYLARVPTGVDPNDEETFEIVATKIVGVQFSYLLAGGGEAPAPGTRELKDIRALRVTLTGATDATQTGTAGYLGSGQADNVKTRSMSTIVELRNR